jgi:subtilase family serine protease
MLVSLLVLLSLVASASALEQHGRWTLVPGAAHKERVTVKVLLKQSAAGVAALEKHVREVSDPWHPRYTHYLSNEQIAALVGSPHAAAVAQHFVEHVDGKDVRMHAHGDSFTVNVDAELAEQAFGVELGVWRNEHGRMITRSRKPHVLPAAIAPHVDLLLGLSDFSMLKRRGGARRAVETATATAPAQTGGAPAILAAMSRGGNTITVDIQLACSDGSIPTTLPPCPQNPIASVVAFGDLTYAGAPTTINATADLSKCRVTSTPAVVCSATMRSQFYQPVAVSGLVTYRDLSVVATAPFDFVAVATPPVMPADLRSLMNIPNSESVTAGATSSVVEFEEQYFSTADLAQFYKAVGVPVHNVNQVTVIGPNNQTNPGGEAALDIEMLGAIAQGSPIVFWSIFENSTAEIDDILSWAIAVANDTNAPQVNSLSYGMTEDHVDAYQGKGYLKRSDVEFAKLAAKGLTVIIASGDEGAGDLGGPPMSHSQCKTLHADWPSQSPYVTAIGSTYISPLAEPACYGQVDCSQGPLGEVGVSMDYGLFWTSGGGASNITKTAWFQHTAVAQYLASGVKLPPAFAFNAKGRFYNDAVAVGHNLMVVLNGTFMPIDGTSASAPIYAAVITLLNDQRLRVGKKPLGLLNPLLYKLAETAPDTRNELLVGNNRCGAYGPQPWCCDWGYEAAPGIWSPTGGVGSPNYAALKREVLLLP